jgi:hypothetical protein
VTLEPKQLLLSYDFLLGEDANLESFLKGKVLVDLEVVGLLQSQTTLQQDEKLLASQRVLL